MVRAGLIEKVTFKQRFARSEEVSHADIWAEERPGAKALRQSTFGMFREHQGGLYGWRGVSIRE